MGRSSISWRCRVDAKRVMLSKIWANGLVILVAAYPLSETDRAIVARGRHRRLARSVHVRRCRLRVFSHIDGHSATTATFTTSMGQFGLLVIPVLVILQMLSGSATPMETMPVWLQGAMQNLSTPHFVSFSQAVLYRAAGLDIVWPELLVMAIISAVYFVISGVFRFRKTLVVLQ